MAKIQQVNVENTLYDLDNRCVTLSASSGTLTADQLAILQASDKNYILYQEGIYRLIYKTGSQLYYSRMLVATDTLAYFIVQISSGSFGYSTHPLANKTIPSSAGNLASLSATGAIEDSGLLKTDIQKSITKEIENDPDNSSFDITISDGQNAPLLSTVIKGKTVAWNQILGKADNSISQNGITISFDASTGKITIVVSDSTTGYAQLNISAETIISEHVYFTGANKPIQSGIEIYNQRLYGIRGSNVTKNQYNIETATSTTTNPYIYVFTNQNTPAGTYEYYVNVIDLTAEGYTAAETTDVATFKAAFLRKNGYPLPLYIPYNAGSLVNMDGKYLLHGRNLWDEEWENGIINSDGSTSSDNTRIRSKNYIPVKGGSTCYFCQPTGIGSGRCAFYDANKNFVSYNSTFVGRTTFAVPENACYMKFCPGANYGTTYNHDICINLSDASFNGTYEPYYNGGSIDLSSAPLNGTSTSYDEKDFATGKRTTRFVRKVLDGSENWTWYNPSNSVLLNDALDGRKGLGSTVYLYGVCNRVASQTDDVIDYTVIRAAASNTTQLQIVQIGQNFGITDLSVNGWKAWLASNNLEFIYELATPVTTTETPQPVYTQYGYNVLEPVSGGVQSAEVKIRYISDKGTSEIIDYVDNAISTSILDAINTTY